MEQKLDTPATRRFICISGKAQHGKTLVATMLKDALTQKGYSCLIINQADLLKFICKLCFDWDGIKDESGRNLLQKVGTDIIRQQQPDFWVDFIETVTGFFPGKWDYILIPDTRFPNEIERLKTPNSSVRHVRVVRLNFDTSLSREQQRHPSETALDKVSYDYIITNDGDLDCLNRRVLNFLEEILQEDKPHE